MKQMGPFVAAFVSALSPAARPRHLLPNSSTETLLIVTDSNNHTFVEARESEIERGRKTEQSIHAAVSNWKLEIQFFT